MKDLATIYEAMKPRRRRFDEYALETAAYTLPWLNDELEKHGLDPTTIIGAQCVRSLGSSILKAMLPPGVKANEFDLMPQQWNAIMNHPEGGQQVHDFIRARLDQKEQDVHKGITQKTSRSRFASAIRRMLIEGTTVLINLPDSVRVYPLRSLVIEREAGVVRLAVVCEKYTDDPVADATSEAKDKEIYTLVDFEKGEVWKQVGDGSPYRIDDPADQGKETSKFEFTHEQVIVATCEIPDCEDYAPGYAYHFLRAFRQLNHAEKSIGEAQAAAAWNRPYVTPGSVVSMNIKEFFEAPAGTPYLGTKEDVGWMTNEIKIGDWAFVVQLIQRKQLELATAFAMGIKDRPVSDASTATEVLQIIDEINTQTHDLIGTIEETMLVPTIRSEMVILERSDPLLPGDANISKMIQDQVKVVVVTGSNAIQKQKATEKLILFYGPAIMQQDPTVRANGKNMIDRIQQYSYLEEGNLFRTATPLEMQMMAAQAGVVPQASGVGQRTDTVMTRGGPQPVQPPQPAKAA